MRSNYDFGDESWPSKKKGSTMSKVYEAHLEQQARDADAEYQKPAPLNIREDRPEFMEEAERAALNEAQARPATDLDNPPAVGGVMIDHEADAMPHQSETMPPELPEVRALRGLLTTAQIVNTQVCQAIETLNAAGQQHRFETEIGLVYGSCRVLVHYILQGYGFTYTPPALPRRDNQTEPVR
jgi:hypothetical protein